jgi:Ca2+-transporting ATPase
MLPSAVMTTTAQPPSEPDAAGGDRAARSAAITGLSTAEAAALLHEHGPNEVAQAKPVSPWALLLGQLASPVIWLLLGACVLAGALGEVADATAIFAIVLINSVVGFIQEYRAERSVQALRALTAPRARVLRDGHAVEIPAAQVVPGDVLLLDAGDVVAADARLLEANALLTNEATLTGESTPAEKSVEPAAAGAALAERRDSVFMATAVANGSGKAAVTATGMRTELGKIAHLLTTATDETTPLQKQLAVVGRLLLYICLAIVGAVALLGVLRGRPLLEVVMSAVSLAVAAVPEGLPAVVTIALAIGVRRMVDRHVLVRRLPAVETLGSATVICTDKTGTLTTGAMRLREVWGPDPARILDAAAACCDAELDDTEQGGTGDPTEIALLIAAAERGIRRADIERTRPRTLVHPFDAQRMRMSIGRADGVLYLKGALESVLPLCTEGGHGAAEANAQLAERGLRVLAVAVGATDREEQLHLLGLVGIADPPRAEAIDAIAAARAAGIRTVMITGDQSRTAIAIGRELGLLAAADDAAEVIHARATPEDKIGIVREWKARGAVVAMTGDGVNDAPALREAHIGIAMGKTGTEVTREASDMILTDDNFASIVAAVREGRGIFDNIRKTLVYLLGGNASELAVMLGAAAVGLPLPLLPLHLLWINLVTDGLPALALVMDPVDPDVMKRPPRRPGEPMLGAQQWRAIGLTALIEASVVLGVFVALLDGGDVQFARTMAFTVLVCAELMRSFAARSPTRLFWQVGAFTNLRLIAVVALSLLLQVGLTQIPATQRLFALEALSPVDYALAFGLGLIPVSVLELLKLRGARNAQV